MHVFHIISLQETDVYLSYVTELAQNMMEGSFARMLSALQHPPSELFNAFTGPLMETIRYESSIYLMHQCDTAA